MVHCTVLPLKLAVKHTSKCSFVPCGDFPSVHCTTLNTKMWSQGGPKMGQKDQKQHLLGPGGPWCPQMAGTRWNKIGTVYRQSGLTILTTLHHPKYQNVVPGRSQTGSKGSKTAFIGSRCSMVPQNGWNKVQQVLNGIQAIRTDHSVHIAPP